MHLAAAVSPRVKLLTTHDDLLNCLFLRDLVWQGPVCFCTGPLPYHALPALALSYKVHFEPRRFEPPVERAPVPGAHRCAMPCHAMPWSCQHEHCTVNSPFGAWPSVLFPISLSFARSIYSADYAISDNACCPGPQALSQSRLRVSGALERQ